eukprot:TRINITY_DN977_c0_g2_i4.p1 TRINITY_DN977_c0_g2~~TRINITY_DN977_c0_g2_i4.p1  ORF type:complete len:479 (+),score=136.89 TRINITY_DN977_c0_g2_i4:35-1438(+)
MAAATPAGVATCGEGGGPVFLLPHSSRLAGGRAWARAKALLSAPILDWAPLCDAVCTLHALNHGDAGGEASGPFSKNYTLHGLKIAVEFMKTKYPAYDFFGAVLPALSSWALELESLFTEDYLPALVSGKCRALSLTRKQVRCLLANTFFCNTADPCNQTGFSEDLYGSLCWIQLYLSTSPVSAERIKCQLNYFDCMLRDQALLDGPPIVIYRGVLPQDKIPDFANSTVPLCQVSICEATAIETTTAGYHVDFANKRLHINSIIASATQEEVLFSIKPEIFVAMLVCEMMQDNEAIIISGARLFSTYSGYQHTFTFTGKAAGTASIPDVVAIDAVVAYGDIQFEPQTILRDTAKAYLGFCGIPGAPPTNHTVVATGNWGCGAFGGHLPLKYFQQVIAASVAGRNMEYCPYDPDVAPQLRPFDAAARASGANAGQLYRAVATAAAQCDGSAERFSKHLLHALKNIACV